MHTPPIFHEATDIGLTGASCGRHQRLTGKVVLQVEVLKVRKTFQCGVVTERQYFTVWRDASLEESIRVKHRVELVSPEIVAKAKVKEE